MKNRTCNLVHATLIAVGAAASLALIAQAEPAKRPQQAHQDPVLLQKPKQAPKLVPQFPGRTQPASATTNVNTATKNGVATGNTAPAINKVATPQINHGIVRGVPANDACANAEVITSPSTVVGSTLGATNDYAGICGASGASPDVWYVLTPTASETLVFSTCGGAAYDTVLSIHSSACGPTLLCLDDSCGLQTSISYAVTSGVPIWIRVSGFAGGSGDFQMVVGPPVLSCQPCVGIAENEPDCGLPTDTVNGGCNSFPEVFTSIALGDTICGTAGNNGGTRDTDWYDFVLASDTEITWTMNFAAFDWLIGTIDSPCPATNFRTFALGANCGAGGSVTECLPAGTYYLFAATSGFGGTPCGAEYSATITGIPCIPPPPPANDECGTPETIPSGALPIFVAYDLTQATTGAEGQNEFGCNFFGFTGIDSDVWYTYTHTDPTGPVLAETCGMPTDTKIAIYDGTGCPADGTSIACNDDACGLQTQVAWTAIQGNTYTLQLGTYPGAFPGGGTMTIRGVVTSCQPCVGIAENEPDCGLPTDTVNGGCNSFPEVFTSIALGDTICGTAGNNGGTRDTDWYDFVLASDTEITWTMNFAAFDWLIGTIDSPCPATAFRTFLTGLSCDAGGSVTECLPAGTYYLFAATSGFGGTPCGAEYSATITGVACEFVEACQPCVGIAENEPDCGLPTDTVNGGCNSFPEVFTSIALGDTICGTAGNNGGTRDTDWYELVLASDTEITWTMNFAAFDWLIGTIDSPCPATAFRTFALGANCDAGGSVTECLPAGTYYLFAATSGFAGVPCGQEYSATITGIPCVPPPPPANDDCANAQVVTAPSSTPGSNINATNDGTGSCGASNASADVWYEFTAPVSYTVQIDTYGSAVDTVLSIWTACPLDGGTEIACNDDNPFPESRIDLPVSGGTTYFIRVAGFAGGQNNFILNLSAPPVTTGACCDGAICTIITSTDCATAGGSFLGAGSACTSGGGAFVRTPNLAILDNTTTTDDLVISGGGTITDLNVELNVTHTWQGDVAISLTHVDTGTSVDLVNRPDFPATAFGFSNDNYGNNTTATPMVFDDAAATRYDNPPVAAPGTLNVTGSWKNDTTVDVDTLAVFNGESLNGTWRLTAFDGAGGDTGTVTRWALVATPGSATCTACVCRADFNGNGTHDVPDIFAFLAQWFGPATPGDAADFNCNGAHDVPDIFAFLAVWFGPACP